MDKLSDLLQEAKPLYKKRKRQKTIAKLIFTISVPVMLFSSIMQLCIQGDNLYFALETNKLQIELLENDFALGL